MLLIGTHFYQTHIKDLSDKALGRKTHFFGAKRDPRAVKSLEKENNAC